MCGSDVRVEGKTRDFAIVFVPLFPAMHSGQRRVAFFPLVACRRPGMRRPEHEADRPGESQQSSDHQHDNDPVETANQRRTRGFVLHAIGRRPSIL